MSSAIVKTQAELDAALADESVNWIEIRSEHGVWLSVRASDSASVTAYDSASVRASGSASVTAYDSASVTAYDSASVTASGSASVTASGSASVTAYDSASVRASGSASVRASDSASVTAYDSASVRASDSASVTAYDSASVTAYDSASVTAYDSASVTAYDSASVRATPKVAVHLHSASVKVQGGVVIDVSKPLTEPSDWCDYHGVKVSKSGVATLYKAVRDDYVSSWGMSYAPGTKPSATDWQADDECGHGLHFSPSPAQALAYDSSAKRFLEVGVRLADLRPLLGGTAKCKAPAVVRACVEVDIHGNRISA